MKVGIVEDQVLYQRYLSDIVTRELGYEIAICTGDATVVLEQCKTLGVELLILDLKIEHMYGLELAETLLNSMPRLKILAYSGEINPYNIKMVEALGIRGFLDKSDPAMKDDAFLIESIQRVVEGHFVYSPNLKKMKEDLAKDQDAFHKVLSPKKITILKYIARCMTDEEISQIVGTSSHTVRKHRTEIMQHLQVDSTHRLIRYAQEHGFAN